MTNSERDNIIFMLFSISGLSMDFLNKLDDDTLQKMYNERIANRGR